MNGLSTREEEVLALLAEGLSNREIALALGLSRRTIETYLHRLYKKLGVHNRAGAVARYLQRAADGPQEP